MHSRKPLSGTHKYHKMYKSIMALKKAVLNKTVVPQHQCATSGKQDIACALRKDAMQATSRQVPIDAILCVEFDMLGMCAGRQEIRERYENNVQKVMDSVSRQLGFGAVQGADGKRLCDAISNAEENMLFPLLSGAFRDVLKASFSEKSTVVASVEDGKFNCYSSTVLLADVLLRLGKPIEVITAPGHVFLSGGKYAFETTVHLTPLTFHTAELGSRYPFHQKTGVEMLEAAAWNNKGTELEKKGMFRQSTAAYSNALKINPNDAEVLYNLSIVYFNLEQFDDAIATCNKLLDLNPKDVNALKNLARSLAKTGKHVRALMALSKARSYERDDW